MAARTHHGSSVVLSAVAFTCRGLVRNSSWASQLFSGGDVVNQIIWSLNALCRERRNMAAVVANSVPLRQRAAKENYRRWRRRCAARLHAPAAIPAAAVCIPASQQEGLLAGSPASGDLGAIKHSTAPAAAAAVRVHLMVDDPSRTLSLGGVRRRRAQPLRRAEPPGHRPRGSKDASRPPAASGPSTAVTERRRWARPPASAEPPGRQ